MAQDLLDGVQSELDTAFSLGVWAEAHLASVAVIHGVGPKQVTKESLEGRLDESVDTVDVGLVL